MRALLLVCVGLVMCGMVALAAEPKEGDKGTFVGTVTEVGDKWFRAKNEAGDSLRFMPRWIGGMPQDGGGLDKEILAKIKILKAGDKVEVAWHYEEHLRALSIKVLEK